MAPISEEILLSSPDEIEEQPDTEQFKIITGQLMQDSKWKMQRKLFRIHNHKYLSVKEHSLTSQKAYWFPLAALDPEPEHHRHISWKLLLGAVISCQIAILLIYLRLKVDLGHWTSSTTIMIIVFVLATLILTALTIFTYTNHFTFHSHKARYPIAVVLNNLPSKQECRQFIALLSEHIQRARKRMNGDESRRMASEVSHMRRLRDEKAISEKEYARAKKSIFSQY